MLAGEKRFETVLMETLKGDVIVKSGAEGVYVAILPSLGYGAALKINDGSAHASEVACGALLQHLGYCPSLHESP